MQHRTLLAPILLVVLQTAAQAPASLSSLPAVTIRIQELSSDSGDPTAPPACFSHFEVLDERTDTTRIGIHTRIPDFGRNFDRQLVFTGSASDEIADYLNRHYTRQDAPYTALIILRTLWLSDANNNRAALVRHPELRLERTHIRIKAEIYAICNDRYIPLLRFDTLQTAWKKRIISERSPYFEWGQNLALLIDQLADSASRLMPRKENAGQRIALDDIRQFNATRFDAPINYTAPASGVYANFEEFRNNTPSIKDFEIRTEDNEMLLYVRESGTAYYSHDAWGYCDGKAIYIMRDGILCPAWKVGKAFYIPAAAGTGNGSALSFPHSHDYRQRSIYFIDMDTGDIY